MFKSLILSPLLAFVVFVCSAQTSSTLEELNAYWKTHMRSLQIGDLELYSTAFHPDAVMYTFTGPGYSTSKTSTAIEKVNRPSFEKNEAQGIKMGFELKLTSRINTTDSAREEGLAHYWEVKPDGTSDDYYGTIVWYLVKTDSWKAVATTSDFSSTTKEDWDTAQPLVTLK